MGLTAGAKRPNRLEGGSTDSSVVRTGGMRIVGHGIVLNRETLLPSQEEDYEKARRCLIYRDMVEKAGSIQWALLAVWPYQPTHGEVIEAMAEAGKKKPTGKFGRARCDSCNYAWFPRSEDARGCPRCSRWKVTREGLDLECMDADLSQDGEDDD